MAEVLRPRDPFRRSGQAPNGQQRGAGDEQAEGGREGDAAERDDGQHEAQVRERVVGLVERQGDLPDAPFGR